MAKIKKIKGKKIYSSTKVIEEISLLLLTSKKMKLKSKVIIKALDVYWSKTFNKK